MDADTNPKAELPSRYVTEGPQVEVFRRTPYIADLKPGGRYVAKDLFEAGGVPILMKTLFDHGHLARRRQDWKAREVEFGSGYLWKYAHQVGPALNGVVTHPGGAAEKKCYADI